MKTFFSIEISTYFNHTYYALNFKGMKRTGVNGGRSFVTKEMQWRIPNSKNCMPNTIRR